MKKVMIMDHGGGKMSWSITTGTNISVSELQPKRVAVLTLAHMLMEKKGTYQIEYIDAPKEIQSDI